MAAKLQVHAPPIHSPLTFPDVLLRPNMPPCGFGESEGAAIQFFGLKLVIRMHASYLCTVYCISLPWHLSLLAEIIY